MADKKYKINFFLEDGRTQTVEFTAPSGADGKDGRDGIDGKDGEKGDKGETGERGADGSDATVTKENIYSALGYTPANDYDVTQLKSDFMELSNMKSGAIVQTASGESIVTNDSSDDPLRGLRVFGKTEQFTTTGKNKFNINADVVIDNVTYVKDDSSVTITAGANLNAAGYARLIFENIKVDAAKTYIVSFDTDSTVEIIVGWYGCGKTITTSGKTHYAVTLSNITTATFSVGLMVPNTTVKFSNIQIEEGTVETSYEPYTGGIPSPNPQNPQEIVSVGDDGNVIVSVDEQTLPISTPNGLCGIKVTNASIATYTDEDGNMWVADEIDFERGVYVKRLAKARPYKPLVFTDRKSSGRCVLFAKPYPFGEMFVSGETPSMSTIAQWSSWANGADKTFTLSGEGMYYKDSTKTLEEVNALFAELGTNFEVLGVLATPIETPLTAEELEAYKALHTNYPTTTILSEAHMEVKYGADTKNYIDNKFAELQTALIALGGI